MRSATIELGIIVIVLVQCNTIFANLNMPLCNDLNFLYLTCRTLALFATWFARQDSHLLLSTIKSSIFCFELFASRTKGKPWEAAFSTMPVTKLLKVSEIFLKTKL